MLVVGRVIFNVQSCSVFPKGKIWDDCSCVLGLLKMFVISWVYPLLYS